MIILLICLEIKFFFYIYNICNLQVDENTLNRLSCVLACRRFHGPHTYDKIAELLHEIICAFSIESEQLVSTITDNGANFV